MKTRFISLFFIISLLIVSCNLSLNMQPENRTQKAPSVNLSESGIIIQFYGIPVNVDYINLYRTDLSSENKSASKIDDEDENEEKESENIGETITVGIIYPQNFQNPATPLFEDSNVTSGHIYTYSAKFVQKGKISYTKASSEIKAVNGYYGTNNLSYKCDPKNVSFIYVEDGYELVIRGDIASPDIKNFDSLYTPMLLIKSPTSTQAFPISTITADTIIPMNSILSKDFFDVDITIVGLMAQRKALVTKFEDSEEDEEEKILYRIWTKPTEITVKNTDSNTIFIPATKYSDGFEY